eukprot:CAMPEP_0170553040 /NCGR_PEP_ID=MMETSP0211-20121228/10911_1 /TAXON_ID=311385 /ORGANISM="Pseudokeronopsis sp., Strain OXSARD2" /LENGTH=47 /DNA_ID= /DNA_START= /DNA_END= /DNA_ORIENTATION=
MKVKEEGKEEGKEEPVEKKPLRVVRAKNLGFKAPNPSLIEQLLNGAE